MYTKTNLMYFIARFNEKAALIGDYPINFCKTDIKSSPYQLRMITEDGLKHKYAGTIQECIGYIVGLL
jgi:hypothetical protein